MIEDVRFALRMLRKEPLTTAIVVLTLAVGIGANTAIFSVLRTVVLEPLPFPDADSLVVPAQSTRQFGRSYWANGRTLAWLRAHADGLAALAAYRESGANLRVGDGSERVGVVLGTDDLFDVLGVEPAAGRGFVSASSSSEKEALISDSLHARLFGAGESGLGKTLILDGEPVRIAGIMPPGFSFPVGGEADLWMRDELEEEVYSRLFMVGRRKPGVGPGELGASAGVLTAQYCAADENRGHCESSALRFEWLSLHEVVFGQMKPYAWALTAAVAMLLLIACVNVSNLLLARGAGRRREIALRIALGAGRGRLVRQLLTESAVLAVAGALLGLLLAPWAVEALIELAGASMLSPAIGLDLTLACYTGAIALATALVFGILPALTASPARPYEALKAGGLHHAGSRGVGRMRRTLVVAEVALALLLLAGAGLSLRSLRSLRQTDTGLDPRGLLSARVSPDPETQPDEALARFAERLRSSMEALPGVRSAAISNQTTLAGFGNPSWSYAIEGRPNPTGADYFDVADWRVVTPGYFGTLGIPIVEGRDFRPSDRADARPVVIVDERFAEKAWPGATALGKRVTVGIPARDGRDGREITAEVIGVVGHVNDVAVADDRSKEQFYWPHAQWMSWDPWRFMSLVVRTEGAPGAQIAPVREALHALDPKTPLHFVRSVEELIDRSLARQRFTSTLLALFAAVAALLAIVGLYGLLSYSVSRRTRELGIRLALGALPGRLLAQVVQRGVALAGLGALVGMAAALVLMRAGEALLGELSIARASGDELLLGALAVVLCLVAAVASYVPARRAARIEPASALRCE